MSTRCKIYALGLLMNSRRPSDEELAQRPLNHPSECAAMGMGPGGKRGWWQANSLASDPEPLMDEVDFTLVSQVTMTRLWMVSKLCEASFSVKI